MFKCKTWAHFSGEITVLPDGGDWAFTVYSLGDCLSSPPKTIAMLKLITMIITGQVVIVVVVVVVATVIVADVLLSLLLLLLFLINILSLTITRRKAV